jgi:uncharacterized protein
MKFTEHRDPNVNMIQQYSLSEVRVNQQRLNRSAIISQQHLVTDWPISHIDQLNAQHLDALLQLKPEVLIIGSGEHQRFPASKWFGYCAQHGVSLEVMANDAACRTYNILTTEDRVVILGLILPD